MLDRSEVGKRGYLHENFRLFHLKDSRAQKLDYHYHEFDKLILLLNGKVTYVVEGVTYFLQPWDLLLVQRARDVAQYLIELYLRFPPDRETGLALRRYDEMLCQTYPHIAAMMTNKNTRLLRAGRYLPYRTLSAWARGKQSNGGIL